MIKKMKDLYVTLLQLILSLEFLSLPNNGI